MHFFTFAEKDTTIYESSGSLNAGLDEILEIRKDVSDTGDVVDVSRILIKFDITEISKLSTSIFWVFLSVLSIWKPSTPSITRLSSSS